MERYCAMTVRVARMISWRDSGLSVLVPGLSGRVGEAAGGREVWAAVARGAGVKRREARCPARAPRRKMAASRSPRRMRVQVVVMV